jgi:hypothetical protein
VQEVCVGSVASLRNGEWYQDLYGWSRVLDLSSNCRLAAVRLEPNDAGHVDDVIAYPRDPKKAVEFVQLKYHVGTEAGRYSTEFFIEPPPAAKRAATVGKSSTAKSLLQKFWTSWQALRHEPRGVLLVLVSNWSWDDADPLASLISGLDDALTDAYFTAGPTTRIGNARERWCTHLGADPREFEAFMRAMRFRLGRGSIQALTQQVAERMADRCLHADDNAVSVAVTQVGAWIREGLDTVTPEVYQRALDDLRLKLPEADPAVRVCIHTIERQTYAEAADYTVDWCDRFLPLAADKPFPRGHAVEDPAAWNRDFLPELEALKAQLNTGPIRLLRLRGQARLSAWIAFGHVFERRAGYVLEVNQYGEAWRTDVPPAPDMQALAAESEVFGRGPDLAIAISIANHVAPAARDTIDTLALPVDTFLTFMPTTGVGPNAIPSAAHLRAFVDSVRKQISGAMSARGATRAHLFYSGPLAGAAFLGHALGAAVPEVQVYEFQRPGYAPSCLLRG